MIQCLINQYGQFNRQRLEPVCWPHFDLICIHRGQLKIRFKNQAAIVNEHETILVYPETRFTGQSVTPLTDVSIHHFMPNPPIDEKLGFRMLERRDGFLRLVPADWKTLQIDLDRLIRIPDESTEERVQSAREALMLLILLNTLSEYHRPLPQSQHKRAMEELLEFLEQNTHQNITLTEMADRVLLSVSHFRTLFQDIYGVTPGAFFRNVRLQKARRKLTETLTPIKEIARQTGYEEVPHFHRAFKSHFGMSPGTYRRNNKPTI